MLGSDCKGLAAVAGCTRVSPRSLLSLCPVLARACCAFVQIYKTSILVFKDRARYVEGEFRFRQAGLHSLFVLFCQRSYL